MLLNSHFTIRLLGQDKSSDGKNDSPPEKPDYKLLVSFIYPISYLFSLLSNMSIVLQIIYCFLSFSTAEQTQHHC
jgi:hypothetical protein